MYNMTVRYFLEVAVVKISVQSDVYYRSYCPKIPQNEHNWVLNPPRPLPPPPKKNEGFQEGKVENSKYPKVNICGSINYGWIVLL